MDRDDAARWRERGEGRLAGRFQRHRLVDRCERGDDQRRDPAARAKRLDDAAKGAAARARDPQALRRRSITWQLLELF